MNLRTSTAFLSGDGHSTQTESSNCLVSILDAVLTAILFLAAAFPLRFGFFPLRVWGMVRIGLLGVFLLWCFIAALLVSLHLFLNDDSPVVDFLLLRHFNNPIAGGLWRASLGLLTSLLILGVRTALFGENLRELEEQDARQR